MTTVPTPTPGRPPTAGVYVCPRCDRLAIRWSDDDRRIHCAGGVAR
jgi:hypothetical protein